MPVWPADLPTPIFKSTLITGIKSTLREDMDSGPASSAHNSPKRRVWSVLVIFYS